MWRSLSWQHSKPFLANYAVLWELVIRRKPGCKTNHPQFGFKEDGLRLRGESFNSLLLRTLYGILQKNMWYKISSQHNNQTAMAAATLPDIYSIQKRVCGGMWGLTRMCWYCWSLLWCLFLQQMNQNLNQNQKNPSRKMKNKNKNKTRNSNIKLSKSSSKIKEIFTVDCNRRRRRKKKRAEYCTTLPSYSYRETKSMRRSGNNKTRRRRRRKGHGNKEKSTLTFKV